MVRIFRYIIAASASVFALFFGRGNPLGTLGKPDNNNSPNKTILFLLIISAFLCFKLVTITYKYNTLRKDYDVCMGGIHEIAANNPNLRQELIDYFDIFRSEKNDESK